MEINKDIILKDVYSLSNHLIDGVSRSRVYQEYLSLSWFSDILLVLINKQVDFDYIHKKNPKLYSVFLDENDVAESLCFQKIITEEELYRTIFENVTREYDASGLGAYKFYDRFRRYSEKDAKDILLDFFSKHGDKAYKIAKKMFDEKRIQTKYTNGYKNTCGFYAGSTLLQSGYIFLKDELKDTTKLIYLAHEIGHAIDYELYYFSQQKKCRYLDDIFIEVPSSYFEMSFIDYVKDNRIDPNCALTYRNIRMNNLYTDFNEMLDMLDNINKEGEVVVSDLRNSFIYGIAYYMSYAMNELAKQDPKEYFKYYCNVICSRKECDFISLVEMAGIDADKFISGEIARKTFDNQVLALNKRYNIKL